MIELITTETGPAPGYISDKMLAGQPVLSRQLVANFAVEVAILLVGAEVVTAQSRTGSMAMLDQLMSRYLVSSVAY